MNREVHVRNCEGVGVKLPRATRRNIYVRSERAGQRVMASVTDFIQRRLRLKVNADKSAVARPEERHFLGFRLRRDALEGKVEGLLSKQHLKRIAAPARLRLALG